MALAYTTATGERSIAIGNFTHSSGYMSIAIGDGVRVTKPFEVVNNDIETVDPGVIDAIKGNPDARERLIPHLLYLMEAHRRKNTTTLDQAILAIQEVVDWLRHCSV